MGDADEMLLRRQRSIKAPELPLPPETNKAPSTTAALWNARGGGRADSSFVVLSHLKEAHVIGTADRIYGVKLCAFSVQLNTGLSKLYQ